jgi:hypothetical protein
VREEEVAGEQENGGECEVSATLCEMMNEERDMGREQ